MNDRDFAIQRFEVPGSFGDKTVRMVRFHCGVPDAPLVVLLHGVYGHSQAMTGNKYADMAVFLARLGVDAVLVETSRMRRDRLTFKDDRNKWIRAAFWGKTFAQELDDCVAACRRISGEEKNFWLWGFSLGGIIALLIAGGAAGECLNLRGLVTSGSGDTPRGDVAPDFLRLPILSTLGGNEKLHAAAADLSPLRCEKFLSFYGSCDDTFERASCERLVDMAPLKDKKFHVIEGVDHAFRQLNGAPSKEPLKIMVNEFVNWAL